MPVAGRQLFKNATLTAAQVVVSAAFMFAIYKYLLVKIGPERLGIWSIVMAVSTVARITDLGFSGGMTRFVAKYQALSQSETVLEIVETGTVSILLLATLVLSVAYPVLLLVLPKLLDTAALSDALNLLPFSLLSFGLLAVAGSFLSTLDGMQRADLRNLILITGTICYGFLIPILVNHVGFEGLGWAQLAQSGGVLLASWWIVRRHLGFGLIPTRWRYMRFKEMLGYNVNLQISTIASFFGDPATKLMLGHFGGLSIVGYYEMATKMVGQFRAIVTNVNQVMVPVITHLHEKGDAGLTPLYRQTYSLLFFVCATFYGSAMLAVPLISVVWIGEYHNFFVAVAYIMLGTMFVNTLTAPAYFSNLGTGQAGINAISQVVIGTINTGVGIVLGGMFEGPGVVAAYSIAVIIGSSYLMWRFFSAHSLSASDLIPEKGFLQSLFVLAVVLSAAATASLANTNLHLIVTALLFGLALIGITLHNPAYPHLMTILRRRGRRH